MMLYMLVLAAGVAGVAVGLASATVPVLRVLVSAAVVAGWAAASVGIGVWAAQCWDCTVGTQDDRRFAFAGFMIFYGAVALAIVAGIWIGARVWAIATGRRAARAGHDPAGLG